MCTDAETFIYFDFPDRKLDLLFIKVCKRSPPLYANSITSPSSMIKLTAKTTRTVSSLFINTRLVANSESLLLTGE